LQPMMDRRCDRPLFVIDLAVPRDVTADVNEIDGVFLYDIDSLQEIANETLEIRRQEVVRCEEMIDAHVGEYVRWLGRAGDFAGVPGRDEEEKEEKRAAGETLRGACK